ncbi:MAG: GcrA family cell cycle regulator [Brevundimonas sp.]|nr:GcrA family cell cycle regulator [Brevundimonas sp.]
MPVRTLDRITPPKPPRRKGRRAGARARAPGAEVNRTAMLAAGERLALSGPGGTEAAPPEALDQQPLAPPLAGAGSILSVRRTDCRWPYGDPGTAGFSLCGRPTERGVYCAAHAEIAYRAAPSSIEGLMRLVDVTS